MKDNGLVVSTKEDMAQVEVKCLVESCQRCPARSLCIVENQSKSILTVRNPIKARPGDEVLIELPEATYNKKLILLFGSLLIASLLGMGAGYLCSMIMLYSSSGLSLLGLVLGLILAGTGLFHYFRKRNRSDLYPVIREVISSQ